jgi:hypothetical protein
MTAKLTEAQQTFLKMYDDLLNEVEKSIMYVSECYKNNDCDIGDRLLKGVTSGLLPYDEENMTIQSIFHDDKEALKALNTFQSAVQSAVNVDEMFTGAEERLRFLHESLLRQQKEWQTFVKKKMS